MTLRTWTDDGTVDADTGDPDMTTSDATIKAVLDARRTGTEERDFAGEVFHLSLDVYVQDGDEPTLAGGLQNPLVIADGQEYAVRNVLPPFAGLRQLLTEKVG